MINHTQKRFFDFGFALLGIILSWWLILIAWTVASIETRSNGFFTQKRVGRRGKLFRIIKVKTMIKVQGIETNISTTNDVRITRSGRFFRRTNVDELPQLFNILIGQMSFVGPRPDVVGYANRLSEDDRIILTVRPGITGPATLKYRNESTILAGVEDPVWYNDHVIWPDKVSINKAYIRDWSFMMDLKYIAKTVMN